MVSSKLFARRANAGTPKVTRAIRRCKHPPPGHNITCEIFGCPVYIMPGDPVGIELQGDDDGYEAFVPGDRIDVTLTGGSMNPPSPLPFINNAPQQFEYTAPDEEGTYVIEATFWWPDLCSCACQCTVIVEGIPNGPADCNGPPP